VFHGKGIRNMPSCKIHSSRIPVMRDCGLNVIVLMRPVGLKDFGKPDFLTQEIPFSIPKKLKTFYVFRFWPAVAVLYLKAYLISFIQCLVTVVLN
jgi:hypothetical protein